MHNGTEWDRVDERNWDGLNRAGLDQLMGGNRTGSMGAAWS